MLAHDLIAEAPAEVDLFTKTRSELDVTDAAAVAAAIGDIKSDIVLNAAAYTDVDGAESERDRVFLVNGEGPAIIGRAVAQLAQRTAAGGDRTAHSSQLTPSVVHYSTDYVFGGALDRSYSEDDPTEPLGVYGASKLDGERELAESGARYLIIRTQWLFGLHGRSFPRTMWERATAGKPTRVVNDQVGRPTYTVDLARATWGLVAAGAADAAEAGGGSIVHIANHGTGTWHEVAKRIFEVAGVPELLKPCLTAEYPTPAKRPARSVLDTTRYHDVTGDSLPHWEDRIDRFLERLKADG